MATQCRRMRGSSSYQQPSTVLGEAQVADYALSWAVDHAVGAADQDATGAG